MRGWSREAKIGLVDVLVAILAIFTGLLTYEIRQSVGLSPEAVTAVPKPMPFTGADTTPDPPLNANTASPKIPEQIEIIDPVIVKRIKFARGGTSSVVTGVFGSAREHDFLLEATGQQSMTVTLASDNAAFSIYGPDGSSLSETGNATWSGVLPESGDYRVKIFANGDNCRYRLEVAIL